MNPVKEATVLVAVGSVDGIAGAAACIRHSGNHNLQLVFTQAFQVSTIDVASWPAHSKVGFIDLGVNNEGQQSNPQMTLDFVKKIYDGGHSILFIADEHGKKAWKDVLQQCGHTTKELTIRPKDRATYTSSCAILLKKFGDSADQHTKELLDAGNQADQMIFTTHFGQIFNNAVKSNMSDPERRPYLARVMAKEKDPDVKIQGWIAEYAEMQANLTKILNSGKDLGTGIFYYDGSIGPHDATAVFREAYKISPIVVLSKTPVFVANTMQRGTSIATNNPRLHILQIIQEAKITAGGMPAKANLAFADEATAIEAVRKAIE